MSKPITDFINNELKPRLFDYIPAVFPNMEFKRKGNKWISELHIDGSEGTGHKADRAVIKEGYTSVWDTTRQYSKDIISLFMEKNGIDIVEAVNRLCDIVCIDKPTYTPEALEAYRKAEERRTLLEQSADRQQAALFQAEGREVLDYLHRRGWTPEEIKEAGLGYISVEEAKTIGAQYGVGDYYNLSLPIYSGSTLHGFKFRINTDNKNKDLPKYNILQGTNTKKVLFNLTGAQQEDGNIIVVESELDTLHAKVKGLEGIVATGGGGLTEELLRVATGRGIKRITLLFDNDERGRVFTKSSIDLAFKFNITPFIAELPTEYKDMDEYLAEHTIDELRDVLKSGRYGGMYLYDEVLDNFVKESGGTLHDEGEHRLREQVIDIANSTPNEVDRVRVLTSYTNLVKENGKPMFTFEALKAEADKAREFKATLNKAEETKKAVAEITKEVDRGNIEAALKMMSEATGNLSKIDYKTKYSDLLALPTEEDLIRRIRNRQGEIETKYTLSNGRDKEVFTLPAGAITFICAPTSHGKSTFLQNLALQVAKTEEEGAVLYFTFEEDGDSVFIQVLNKYMNLELCNNYNPRSSNNLRALNNYYKASENNYQFIKEVQVEAFNALRTEFVRDYYTTGKLRIIYNDYDSRELIEAIRYISSQTKVRAVFIDYIQLLSKRGNKLQRTEELKDICKDLKNLAVESQLPIVVAAQLNREANSPLELHSQRIAEAADLERIANKILCLWNTSFPAQKSKDSQSELNSLQERLGFELGKSGKIYAKLTKNRGGVVGLEAVLDFNGNTGVITEEKTNNNILF